MPPAIRKQPSRNSLPQPSSSSKSTHLNPSSASRREDALTDFQSRRLARKLDELERTNPTDIPAISFIPPSDPRTNTNTTSQINKKKQSSNVRKILYGKKSLKDWLDELPSDPPNPYLTSTSPIPLTPPRKICSSCGYTGAYKCPRCAEWSCDRVCMEVHERDGGCGIGG
ncbi:zinc finger HIT domain-containing protein 1 [Kwoniella mangroviensis CBS 10435]|uniref:Zinc finger HIT domain-containing protein 1 n=1 Tax=Kwoniella mangroviensis CBS 10435 TaxID=1331196 RepID=A0A1B9IQN2_9TREE|nr:zinc finger HIT domain-containing protein 1 [Kwoniella mangroviensis CBS 10435]